MRSIGRVTRSLLISNSTLYGSDYLDHVEQEIRDFVGNTARIVFVPFAVHDRRAMQRKQINAFAKWVSH